MTEPQTTTEMMETETPEIPTVTMDEAETETKTRKRGRPKKEPESPQARAVYDELEGEEAQSLKDYITQLGPRGTEIRVKITRVEPKEDKGYLDEFYEPITEKDIQRCFGGGTYDVQIQKRGSEGTWNYYKQRRVVIAGLPKKKEEIDKPNGHGQLDDAFRIAERLAPKAPEGPTTDMIQTIVAPYVAQIGAMERRIDDLIEDNRRARDMRSDTSGHDRMIDKLFSEGNNRLDAIREVHASELRSQRENHRAELENLRRDHREDIRHLNEQHAREIQTVKDSEAASRKTLETAHKTQITVIENELTRVRDDLREAKAKIAALEAKKDKSLIEQMGEITALKEAFKEFGGGGEDEGPQKWYESIASNAPAMLETVMDRLRPPEQQNPAPQQGQLNAAPQASLIDQQARASAAALGIEVPSGMDLPPVGQPFRMGDGNVYVRATATEFRMLSAEEIEAAEREARAPSVEDIQTAVRFLESAATNGQDPVTFAQGIRSFVPDGVVDWILEEGVDSLLARAKLEQNSILTQQRGRNFLRAAIEALKEG